MAAASLLAGLSMSISECAAEHSVGQAIGGNFNCHAQLVGGAVWSTKTSLDFAR